VAHLILRGPRHLEPGFVVVPLRLSSELGISLLANTISLTPGTVSSWLSPDRTQLVVHGLDVRDPQGLVADHPRALRGAPTGGLRIMLSIAVTLAFGLVAAALALSLWRLLRGPDKPDRILALDTLYVNAIAILVLLGIHLDSSLYFEAALLIAMMGFVGTIALSKYLLRGDIIE
jgi:multicomponent K+:H+ antiporter subunit F